MNARRSNWPVIGGVAVAMTLLLGVPFLLRPPATQLSDPLILVVISPHDEGVKEEFERAFSAWHAEHFGRPVKIDWRNIGGGGEITRYLQSEYGARFARAWGDGALPETIDWVKVDGPPIEGEDSIITRARDRLTGVKFTVDVVFGGGDYRHRDYANAGFLARLEPPVDYLANVPKAADYRGVELYDPNGYWFGACLSRFGIIANAVVCEKLAVPAPVTWADLARADYFGRLALADPNQSGSAMVCYEMVLQKHGWNAGWPMLTEIAANARYFGSSSTQVAMDVGRGEAVAGMIIDYYGRTQVDYLGHGRLLYTNPFEATATTADPVAVLRGAPHDELARRFVNFVLSVDGQRLWMGKVDSPGGPVKFGLYRPPIRKDIYARFADTMIFPENPYDDSTRFNVDGRIVGRRASLLGAMIKAAFVDNGDLLKKAAQVARSAGPGSPAHARFAALPFDERTMWDWAARIRKADAVERERIGQELYYLFHRKYREVIAAGD